VFEAQRIGESRREIPLRDLSLMPSIPDKAAKATHRDHASINNDLPEAAQWRRKRS
jgi:hypothetical protein